MRSHDTLSTSKDEHERDERRDFPAHNVHGHGAPAISRLVEHAAVPMPPEAPVRTMAIPMQTMFDRRGSEAAIAHKLDTATPTETDDDDEEESEEESRKTSQPQAPVRTKDQSQASAPQPEQPYDILSAEGMPHPASEHQTAYNITTMPPEAASFDVPPAELHDHAALTSAEAVRMDIDHQPDLHQFEMPTPMPPVEAPAAAQSNDAHQTPPLPYQQSMPPTSRQYNTAPTPPSPDAATGSQPPSPPILPPPPPGMGHPNPSNPNQPPSMNTPIISGVNSYNQSPSANTYNQPPQMPGYNLAPVIPPASRRGVDILARVGVVGNFLGNRKTRRTLSKKIELGQKKAAASFAELQARHQTMKAEQNRQAQELQRISTTPVERLAPASNKTEALPPIAPNPNVRPTIRPEAAAAIPIVEQQQQVDPSQPIELQAKQHFERSAWHTIIVDEKGKEVAGAISYGDEFQKQRKEAISDDIGMGLGTAAASTSQAAPVYSGQQPPVQQPSLPSGMTTPSLPQGMPTHLDPQHQLPTKTKKSDIVPGPVFWVMLIVIFAAFFAAAAF